MTTDAIEAGERALDEAIRKWQPGSKERLHRMAAKACIEAAIASGALVPASAVAAERERCVEIVDGYAPATTDMLSSKIAEICDDIVTDIRALSPAPASGEFVVVPRADLQVVVDIAGRDESAIEIECIKEWLKDAATKDGERGC